MNQLHNVNVIRQSFFIDLKLMVAWWDAMGAALPDPDAGVRGVYLTVHKVCSALDPNKENELEFCYLVCARACSPTPQRYEYKLAQRAHPSRITPR